MSLEAIGAVLTVLVIVFVVGHLWFHIVEGILGRLKRLLPHKERPWHPLPTDTEGKKEEAENDRSGRDL